MAVDSSDLSWPEKAEAVIRTLESVDGVSVQMDGDDVREIHVESSSAKTPKQIVRDVQTILRTRLHKGIDHRVVSVAYTRRAAEAPPARAAFVERPAPAPTPPPAPRPRVTVAPAAEAEGESEPAREQERIRFESVNLFVAGPRVQAQVELRWKGIKRMGTASGWGSRDASEQLVANATVAAVQEFLEEEIGLSVADVRRLHLGHRDVIVVGVVLIAHRSEKTLAGSCTVEQDAQQAVVLATLGALNRVLGGLRVREPVEYVLRPASPQEASEAKPD